MRGASFLGEDAPVHLGTLPIPGDPSFIHRPAAGQRPVPCYLALPHHPLPGSPNTPSPDTGLPLRVSSDPSAGLRRPGQTLAGQTLAKVPPALPRLHRVRAELVQPRRVGTSLADEALKVGVRSQKAVQFDFMLRTRKTQWKLVGSELTESVWPLKDKSGNIPVCVSGI